MLNEDLYDKLALDVIRAFLVVLDVNKCSEVGFDLVVKDAFDLTDALYAELQQRKAGYATVEDGT